MIAILIPITKPLISPFFLFLKPIKKEISKDKNAVRKIVSLFTNSLLEIKIDIKIIDKKVMIVKNIVKPFFMNNHQLNICHNLLIITHNIVGDKMGAYDIIIKTVIFYIVLIVVIRLLGKREVGEISVFDLVIIIIVADIATLSINANWEMVIPTLLSLFSLLILQKLLAFLSMRFPFLRKVVDYSPSIIIYDGKLNLEEMKKQAYTVEDLICQAREKGVMDLSEIRMAILESTGQLSIYKKDVYQKQILPIIISGIFKTENLKILDIKEEDVRKYLNEKELMMEDINYLSSDGKKYYIVESL